MSDNATYDPLISLLEVSGVDSRRLLCLRVPGGSLVERLRVVVGELLQSGS